MYHEITIVGNLGRDPEMRVTPQGKQVTNFSVASNRKYTGSDGTTVEEVTWFRVSTWGNMAENCKKYLRKGSMVLVVGRLLSDSATGGPKVYQTQNGHGGASFEVSASNVRFLNRISDGEQQQEERSGGEPAFPPEDEIPF